MFVYRVNNPVIRIDDGGAAIAACAIVGGIVSGVEPYLAHLRICL